MMVIILGAIDGKLLPPSRTTTPRLKLNYLRNMRLLTPTLRVPFTRWNITVIEAPSPAQKMESNIKSLARSVFFIVILHTVTRNVLTFSYFMRKALVYLDCPSKHKFLLRPFESIHFMIQYLTFPPAPP
jgi:hypothetical protein